MGWLADSRIRRMTDPADGTLLVSGISAPPPAGYSAQNFRLNGVVEAPGLPPTAVEVRGVARMAKWPQPGCKLPVTVDRAQPQRLVIRWDQIPANRDLARAQATADAFRLRTGIDANVLADAIKQANGAAPVADDVADADRPDRPRFTEPAPDTGVPATGKVIAIRDVQVPAGFGPLGGVVDLTIELAGSSTVVVRALFDSAQQRAQTAVPGASVPVLIDPANPARVKVALAAQPTPPG